jgi:hypothetical protein
MEIPDDGDRSLAKAAASIEKERVCPFTLQPGSEPKSNAMPWYPEEAADQKLRKSRAH